MLTKTLAGGIIGVVAIGAVWWYLDPVGFSQNPLLRWLNDLKLSSQGYHR
jgi:hypothetical protein